MTQQNNTPEKSVATRAKEAMNKAKKPGTLAGLSTKSIQDVFSAYRGMIAQALPRHLTAERVIQTATTLFTRNPEIAECTAESLLGAVMQSSILGFEPVHSLGHCYLVPFYNKNVGKKEVQFIVGYRGMIELANRSEKLKTIYAEVVYEHDFFEFEFGLEPKIVHRPAEGSRGRMKYVYAVSHYINGGYNFVVLTKADVEGYRMRSASQNNQDKPTFVWATDYEAMAKKTAIRRLFPYLPLSIELQKNFSTDGAKINPEAFYSTKNEKGENVTDIDLNNVDIPDADVVEDENGDKVNTKTGEVVEKNAGNGQGEAKPADPDKYPSHQPQKEMFSGKEK